MTTRIAIAEGTEITTHERVLTAKPPPRAADGVPAYRAECDGVMRAQAGDTGRGPVVVECDECNHVMGLARPRPGSTPPLLAVGGGVAAEDGYARF
jgi:hypothetical protein